MKYSAPSFEIGASGPQYARPSSPQGAGTPARLSDVMAAFLLRLSAYLQGYIKSLSRPEMLKDEELVVIDPALDNSSGPLVRVRMNRRLRRRVQWLSRRGHVQRSGERRLATADDTARCNLSPGQLCEYFIRVYRMNRVKAYGISRVAPRRPNMSLWGDAVCLAKALTCNAPISPD